jgi:putative membrane protein
MRRLLWAVYAFLLLGGMISGGVSSKFPSTAPLFLAVAGVLAVYEHRSAWRALGIAALLGIVFELIGVHTGLPFGRYAYTSTLAPSIFGVPLAIGFAWLILIDFVRGLTGSPVVGALLMAAIDLVIDPLAAGPLRYWRWFDHGPYFGVPMLNFAGWVLASAVILALIPQTERRQAYVGWSVVGFFAVLAFEFRLWMPGATGCAILVLPALRQRLK